MKYKIIAIVIALSCIYSISFAQENMARRYIHVGSWELRTTYNGIGGSIIVIIDKEAKLEYHIYRIPFEGGSVLLDTIAIDENRIKECEKLHNHRRNR